MLCGGGWIPIYVIEVRIGAEWMGRMFQMKCVFCRSEMISIDPFNVIGYTLYGVGGGLWDVWELLKVNLR